MINRIFLRNVASYDDAGVELNNLGKVNIIYGSNGSGKTTISNYLANPDRGGYSYCGIEPTDSNCYVYNKEFRDRNLKQEALNGIFTLGENTIEAENEIERLEAERKRFYDNEISFRAQIIKKQEEESIKIENLKNWLWDNVYKKNEIEFSDAFSGLRNNKKNLYERLISVYHDGNIPVKTRSEIKKDAEVFSGTKPAMRERVSAPNLEEYFSVEDNSLWAKPIVGNNAIDLAELINRLGISDWVKKGQSLITKTNICPFCQKETIDDDFREKLEGYFDETYERNRSEILRLQSIYKNASSIYDGVITSIRGNKESYEKFNELISNVETFKENVNSNMNEISLKVGNLGGVVSLTSSKELCARISLIIEEIDDSIEEYNKTIDNYNKEKQKFKKNVLDLLIDENRLAIAEKINEIEQIKKCCNGLGRALATAEKSKENVEKAIKELKKKIVSAEPMVDYINSMLKNVGFDNFHLKTTGSDNEKYQIVRGDGRIVEKTLSEGEETFVSLLYFIAMLRGELNRDAIPNKKVVVIDDPISSLDSSVLYVVCNLIKKIISNALNETKNIEQVIVFTHNVFFHKEIAFCDQRDPKGRRYNFWVIKKKEGKSIITSYEHNNPIKNSYSLLWAEVKADTISSISLQNAMRRIIENYFIVLGSYDYSRIIEKFSTAEDQMICRSLVSWINDGSHSLPDDFEFSTIDASVETYKRVFKEIFEKTGHIEHYNMMMANS